MSEGSGREFLNLGHAARRAGRLGEALERYGAALANEPDSAEANSTFGLMLLQLGRAEESESPLRKAVDLNPAHATYRMNLAQLLAHQGKLDQAVQLVSGVVAEEPQSWWAWDRLGDLQVHMRNFADAATHYERASGLKPNDPSIFFKWARSSFDSGNVDAAERILRNAARLAPDHEAIYRLGCEIFESQSKWPTLEKLATSWTQLHPKNAEAWRWLAKAQWEIGYLRQAMQSFRCALELGGRDAGNLATFGRLCLSALEFESAAKALDEAEAIDPDNSHMLSGRAIQLMLSGRYDEAKSYVRRSLNVNRDDVSAYKALVQLTNGDLPADDLEALRALAGREDIRVQDRIAAMFSLADCLDARGEVDQAFAAYERANRLASERSAAEGIRYDRGARTRQTGELISLFDAAPPRIASTTAPTPIFIVGMPRSGTTLIESVIGAHSMAIACGELPGMRWILQEFLAQARPSASTGISEDAWKQWREFYWRELPDPKGATFITDKNPWNFDAIGMIPELFPNARIIHVRRNPVETGLSIFRNEFNKFLPFTNRLEDIGHYYGEYARLMAHWENVMGDCFTTVQYENFMAQFDVAAPALLAVCGLDWEESCREYWRNSRVISTMSMMQARRRPERPANRAESYSAHLQPLVESLNASGIDLATGALTPTARD